MSAAVPQAAVAGAVGAARAHLRMVGGEEDAALAALARAAFGVAEEFIGASLIERAFEEVIDGSGAWALLRHDPVAAVLGVTALPVGGAPFVLTADAYRVDIDGRGRGRVRIVAPASALRVAVSYRAGLATGWEDLPAGVAHGVVMLIAHLFDTREQVAAPPAAVGALWRPHRRMRLAGARP